MQLGLVIDMQCSFRIGKKEKRRFNHVVDYRRDFACFMASGFFHACGRGFDSRIAGYCGCSVYFQSAQRPSLVDLASELGSQKWLSDQILFNVKSSAINRDGQFWSNVGAVLN